MNLHEYQGKTLLKKFGVAVPEGIIADTPDAAVDAAHILQNSTGTDKWAIKAQIHAGGRGKGGGVKIAADLNEVKFFANNILGMQLVTAQTGPRGRKVYRVLVEQNIYYKGKTELVDDLLFSNLNDLINKLEQFLDDMHSVKEIFEQLIRALFEIANKQPERVKFLFVLMHDYNFTIQENQRKRILDLCGSVKNKGILTNEINKSIDEEDIFLLGFTYPIEFINLRFKRVFHKSSLGEKEIQKVLKICFSAIRKEIK